MASTLQSIRAQDHSHPAHASITGSFVITAICKDGIIVASESRAIIFDKTDRAQKPLAYYDNMPKIFPVGFNVIAETGQELILNLFFSAIIKSFLINNPTVTRVNDLLPGFIDHCRRTMPPEAFGEIRKQLLFAAGFLDGIPTICFYNEKQPGGAFGCVQHSGFIESDVTSLSGYADDLPAFSATKTAELAEKAIQEYAAKDDRWKTIGGPISIALLTPSGLRWLKNEPVFPAWKYIQDFIRDYQAGKIQVHLIPPTTKQELEDLLSTVSMKDQ